jgi:hypothetical protein
VAKCYEQGDEHSGSVNDWTFLEWPNQQLFYEEAVSSMQFRLTLYLFMQR